MRVAFTLIGGKNWTGGYNYLMNLLRALAEHEPGRLTPVLMAGDSVPADDLAPFATIPGVEFVRSPLFDGRRRQLALLRALSLGGDAEQQRLFDAQSIDVLFEAAQFFGRRTHQPAIAWIPDFQHHHLPQLFSRSGLWKRELGFRAQVAAGRTIMLSSEDARADCERFYPRTRGRTCVVRFAVPPPAPMARQVVLDVAHRHGLPAHYFFMPNQFWQHKNHALVVEALALLRERGRSDIVVAASGRQADPRRPSHVPALQARIAALGVRDQFRLLGLLPHDQVPALMQGAAALLNPSLFEGWSTTVEEARALGVPMLLSDLAVHREQAGSAAHYFDRHSAASLADALVGFPVLDARAAERAAAGARDAATARVRDFAAAFAELVEATARRRLAA
ncbi:glycosyltransferase family 1 protein [uncultured Methylibium sp.]|uniref:glycosyltransferase family 4 protein n=1 Tax=uncultured Methylibium sp. TaxID=381093 RepID=UPI0025D69A90|nr:glycosyltransferase family 1 protein [uncultured Methylibium sp.]